MLEASVVRVTLRNKSFLFHSLDGELGDRLREGQERTGGGWRLVAMSNGPDLQAVLNDPVESARVFAALFSEEFLKLRNNPNGKVPLGT